MNRKITIDMEVVKKTIKEENEQRVVLMCNVAVWRQNSFKFVVFVFTSMADKKPFDLYVGVVEEIPPRNLGKEYAVFSRFYQDFHQALEGQEGRRGVLFDTRNFLYQGSLVNVAEYLSEFVEDKDPSYANVLSSVPYVDLKNENAFLRGLGFKELEGILDEANFDGLWKDKLKGQNNSIDTHATYFF